MKLTKLILLFLSGVFFAANAAAQANASLNILTQNTGLVNVGGTVFLQVSVGNTGPSSNINPYKVKTQISVPNTIVRIPATGHQLPAGWTIINNNGSTINLSNGTDVITVNDVRTILIAVEGLALGGPLTIAGSISFSNGNAPGTAPGILNGDNTADNLSQSTVQVTDPVPVSLSNFNAALINCEPVLKWTTAYEINSDRFEIERANAGTTNWITVGMVNALSTTTSSKYSFADNSSTSPSGKVLYRLKIIDRDGHFKYSAVLPVSINCKLVQVAVYPNPVMDNNLFVSITGINGSAEAILLSLSGQSVFKTTLTNGTSTINTSKIATGVYVLSITDLQGTNRKVKLLIQH